jgi:hypothetical protein
MSIMLNCFGCGGFWRVFLLVVARFCNVAEARKPLCKIAWVGAKNMTKRRVGCVVEGLAMELTIYDLRLTNYD